MLDSGATEIAELVRRLGSRNAVTADMARARLAVVGGRAVDALVAALETDDDVRRARVMPLLGLIQDERGAAPLVAMLRDRAPRLREIAARSLARFPTHEVACALDRTMRTDRSRRARVAAAQSLLEHHAAGLDRAMAPLINVLTDPDEPPATRLAAVPLLLRVGPGVRRGLVGRLEHDANPDLRRAVRTILDDDARTGHAESRARRIAELSSPDWTTWNGAVERLARDGAALVRPLVNEMIARAHDPEFCARAGMALRGLGRRYASSIVAELRRVDDPLPRLMLVDAVGSIGDKAAIYRMRELVIGDDGPGGDVDGLDLHRRVRARAHLHLARVGSRVAACDLRRMLDDHRVRVEPELIEALERIGTRDEIGPLLAAWDREDDAGRRLIAVAVRAIMRRERIRRNARCFRTLTAPARRTLGRILPPVRRRPRGRVAGAVRQPD